MSVEQPLDTLSDDELLGRLAELLRQSRRSEADLVAHIGEVEARGLFTRFAAPSMFVYCTDVLHLSEHEAYFRITVARAAREHPALLSMLADGRLHLAGIAKLAPHLTRENRDRLLARATHKTKRQIEEIVAELAPQPDVRPQIRKLPERPLPARELGPDRVGREVPPTPDPESVEPATELATAGRAPAGSSPTHVHTPPVVLQPLAPARYKVQFTADAGLRDDLEALKSLMRSQVPDGDLASIIALAVREKRERLEARRHGAVKAPSVRTIATDGAPSSRYVSAAVRRAVWRRDGKRCCFRDSDGRRCPERARLEYHHRYPFGLGGGQDVDNICLMCPAHNRYLAELDYGRKVMARHGPRRTEAHAGPK